MKKQGFVCKYKDYSIIDCGYTYVICDPNGLNVYESKAGIPILKDIIDELIKNKGVK